MSQPPNMRVNSFYGKAFYRKSLPGDEHPSDFSFKQNLTPAQLLDLYERNEIIQMACDWVSHEALRERVTFAKEQPVTAKKFDTNFEFKTFDDWLEWIGFWVEIQKAFQWSQLLGNAICVFWDDKKGINHKYANGDITIDINENNFYPANSNPQGYISLTAFYPFDGTSGYNVKDSDDNGKPLLYEIQIKTEYMKKSKKVYVPRERVVEFNNIPKRIQYGGSSRVTSIALTSLAEEQMTEALVTAMKKVAGGIFVGYASSEDEMNSIRSEAKGKDICYLDEIWLVPGAQPPTWIMPDMKLGEYQYMYDILGVKYARGLRMARKVIDGESQGYQSSAGYDLLYTYTTSKELQKLFNRQMEECFYRLGKLDTRFEWNEIIPQIEQPNDLTVGFQNIPKEKEGDKNEQERKQDGKKQIENNGVY